MKKILFPILLAAALAGCASFNHGDIRVERSAAKAMLEDSSLRPFAEVNVSWKNFPYRSATDAIGEGSVSNPKKPRPVPAPPEDAADFTELARDIFARSGLYDRQKGTGALNLELTTFGRWTYRELMRSYFVDTSFIFLLPSSIRVNYYLTADFAVSTGPATVAVEATNKTTFHLLLAPLYPFTAPGGRESRLLRQMLWRTATDVYLRIKAAGRGETAAQPAAPPQPGAQSAPAAPPEDAGPVPPVEPSRDWNEEPPDD